MKSVNGKIVLDQPRSIDVRDDRVTYTDNTGIVISIPMDILIRLYNLAEYDVEDRGLDWEDFCDNLLKKP